MTGYFGNVTGHFGKVTERTERRIGIAHEINHASYARLLLPERACPRTIAALRGSGCVCRSIRQ